MLSSNQFRKIERMIEDVKLSVEIHYLKYWAGYVPGVNKTISEFCNLPTNLEVLHIDKYSDSLFEYVCILCKQPRIGPTKSYNAVC